MNVRLMLLCCACFVFACTGTALCGSKGGDSDVVDFQCPPTVAAGDPIEVTVWVTNNGSSDPGALLQVVEVDALLGNTLNVSETIYEPTDKGKNQKSTPFSYFVTPTGYQSWITWQAQIFDHDYTPGDQDVRWCSTQIIH